MRKQYILLIFLINSVLLDNIIQINNYSEEINNYNNLGNTTFSIHKTGTFNFLNIKVTSKSNYSQYLIYSKTDKNCEKDRYQLSMNPYNNLKFIIPLAQNEDISNFYFCVMCHPEDINCSHETKINALKDFTIQLNEQYSFYISDPIKQSKIKLVNTQPENSIVIIYIKGKNIQNTKIYKENKDDSLTSKRFNNGEIYIENKLMNQYYNLIVDSKEGDYITIGSNIIKNKIGEKLKINDIEYIGYLKRNYLDEICFPLDKNINMKNKNDIIYITGVIYTIFAKTYFKDENKNIIDLSEREITFGNILETIFIDDFKDKSYFCVSLLNESEKIDIDEVVFSIQMTSHKYNTYSQFIYPRLMPGLIYPYSLLKGEIIAFSGINSIKDTQKISFNMKELVGTSVMYIDSCKKYPYCSYNENNLKKLINPINSNKNTVYNYYKNYKDEDINAISSFQPILVVQCLEGNLIVHNDAEICVFEVSIFTENDNIVLKEGDSFSQYLLKGERDLYTISYEGYKNLKKIYIYAIIFSGDIIFYLDTNIEKNKYFLSNKIFYIIEINDNTKNKIINFHIEAEENSFYLIQYDLIFEENENEYVYPLESGINYIESIDINNEKYNYREIKISNSKTDKKIPLLVNFYSQNCKFKVSREIITNGKYLNKDIEIINDYGQEIININDTNYFYSNYKYRIELINDDISKSNELCMIYVNSLEYTDNKKYSPQIHDQQISVNQGVPQVFNFDNNNKIIKYSYHISDISDTVLISFNLIDKTTYNVKVFIMESLYTYSINRYEIISIYKSDLEYNCLEKQVCSIRIYIISEEDIISARLETTIREINEVPTYLEKNTAKQDVLIDNNFNYYYLDIEKNESGEIFLDFKREKGNIYGKIVKKISNEDDEDIDWKDLYPFPKENYLEYEPYLKKIKIKESDTEECDNGCYLLITIEPLNRTKTKYESNFNIRRYTIINRINPPNIVDYNQISIVNIFINDFILGNISPSKNNELYDFFQLILPYDSNEIYIDWQADLPQLFINIGEERATKHNYHFAFNSVGHDTVYKITKEEIIEICEKNNIKLENENSIKDLDLNIGIYTDKVDSLFTSIYALRIFLPTYIIDYDGEPFQLEVLHIRGEQKVQCRPDSIGDMLFCYFAIIFDKSDLDGELIVYLQNQNPNINDVIYYYAKFVDAEKVENNDIEFLVDEIPSYENSIYKYEDSFLPYIYVPKIPEFQSLLIYVETQTNDIIELLSTINHFEKEIIPNPSTAQLFAIKNNEIILNFISSSSYLINIKTVKGYGKLFWEEEKDKIYFLRGESDRLSLTTGKNINNKIVSSRLVINPKEYNLNDYYPQFVFCVTFYPRNKMYNFDQIKIGSSMEFNYRDEDLPINYFAKLSHSSSLSISFNVYNFNIDNTNGLNIEENDFILWGKIISEDEALEARLNKENIPKKDDKAIIGSYSYPIGTLYIDEKYINEFYKINDEDPYIYFTVEKNNFKYNITDLNVELCALMSDDIYGESVFVPEKVYINGQNPVNYKLRINRNDTYVRIEFASNSQNVNLEIYDSDESTNSIKEIEKIYIDGRYLYTFQIINIDYIDYLILKISYNNEDNSFDSKLNNYIFKYINGPNINSFLDYNLKNDKLDVTKIEENNLIKYVINFEAVSCSDCKVSYIVRTISSEKYNKKEIINSIALSENEDFSLEKKDPIINKDNKVSIDFISNKPKNKIIKIMAKINQGPINEFLAYEPYKEKIILKYDYETKKISLSNIEIYKEEIYHLTFGNDNTKIPNYIKVEIISKNSLNQILSFSTNDSEEKRQISQISSDGIVNMWIKKEQFQKDNEQFYLTVECREDFCHYDLNIYGQDYIEFNFNSEYGYYVEKNNQEITFRIKNDLNKNDENSAYLVFYGLGDNNIYLKLRNIDHDNKYVNNYGNIIIIQKQENYKDDYYLDVKATEESFINIGVRIESKEGKTNKKLELNGLEIFGYLTSNQLNKECYILPDFEKYENMNNYYITGIFKNKNAGIFFMNSNFKIENTEKITEEFFEKNYVVNQNNKYICVGIMENTIKELPYILHISNPNKKIGSSSIYIPQMQGKIYPRIIPKGSIVYFSGIKPNIKSENITYHMIATEGYPKMYIYKCHTYPLCDLNYDNIESLSEIIIPNNEINLVSSWQTKERMDSSISPTQYIIVVKCLDFTDSLTDSCKFKTIIYSNEDYIELFDRLPFSKYIIKNEINYFKIDFSYKVNVYQILIDVMIISGDVTLEIDEDNNSKMFIKEKTKYYLGNKISFVISIKDANIEKKLINIKIKGNLNSYYIINYYYYQLMTYNQNIYSGINYLVSFNNEMVKKNIYIYRHKLLKSSSYLVNFNSINCKLNIDKYINQKKIETINPTKEYYIQEYINKYDEELDFYYEISFIEEDSLYEDKNKCMLFVNHLEIEQNENENIIRDILINENYPQRIKFDNFKKIRYIYPHSDYSKEIELYFKNINNVKYSINITYNNNNSYIYECSSDQFFYITKEKLKKDCKINQICKINIQILLLEKDKSIIEEKPEIEISLYEIKNIPYYLPRGIVKNEYIKGNNPLYLYTEYKNNEEGYVTVNFLKGNGKIYGKIVDKESIGSFEEGADWQGHKFPNELDNNLKYNSNNNKLMIDFKDTNICKKSCLVFISIKSTMISDFNDDYKVYPISIISNFNNNTNYGYMTKIKLEPEEYILSSVSLYSTKKNIFYEYYEITIPYEADIVQIELQSDNLDLFVNVGDDRPSKLADFKFMSNWKDHIFEINKNEILKILNKKNAGSTEYKTISNINLVIGIGSQISNVNEESIYLLRVHIPKANYVEINQVKGEHKTLCIPQKIYNMDKYRCLFMVILTQDDFINHLIIYAKSQSTKNNINMYADFITVDLYRNSNNQLNQAIPNQKAFYKTTEKNPNYIYFPYFDNNNYLYVNVESDSSDIIEFITSLSTYDKELTINPNSLQLFALKNKNIRFSFIENKNSLINIKSLVGEGIVSWEGDPGIEYQIGEKDNNLMLTSYLNNTNKIINNNNYKLIITNKNYNINNNDDYNFNITNSGFVFLIEYHLKTSSNDFNEISSGKTIEFINRESNFPLYFYSKIDKIDSDLNIFIIFHDIELSNKDPQNITIQNSEFDFYSNISDQFMLYNIKSNPNLPKFNFDISYKGYYDSALRVGQIYFSKDDLKKYTLNENEIPILFFKIEKSKNSLSNEYKKTYMEISIIKENSDDIITENKYYYGKIINDLKSHKLKIDKYSDFIHIQFASNSGNIKYCINTDKNDNKNSTDIIILKTKIENGKSYIKIQNPKNKEYIYLNIFPSKKNKKIKLNNYVFKYINTNEDSFIEYPIFKNYKNIDYKIENKEKDKKNIKVTFNKIEKYVDVTYSLKIVPKENSMEEEYNNTISITESDSFVTQVKNPKDKDGIISMNALIKDQEIKYIIVIAQIKDDKNIEYITYEPIYLKKEEKKKFAEVIIAFTIVIIIIFTTIVLSFMYVNKKYKKFTEDLNKISFQEPREEEKNDDKNEENLLLGDDDKKIN